MRELESEAADDGGFCLEEPGQDEEVHPDIRAVDEQGDSDVWQEDVVGVFKREIFFSEGASVLFDEPG